MRVCVIMHESDALGAGLAIARAIPALRRIGCEVSVLLPGEGPIIDQLGGCDVTVLEPARPIGVSMRGWREPPGIAARLRQSGAYFASVRRGLRAYRPDVVHINSLHAIPEGVVARCCGFPVVLHAHEIPRPGRKRSATIRAAGAIADVVVAVSHAVASLYADAVAPAKLMTVYNGVAAREHAATATGELCVGTVGSVCRRKGTDVLVAAAQIVRADHRDILFEHVGPAGLPGERDFEADLSRLRGAGRDVTFLGPRPVDSALRRWSIFVLPSREEGFPLASLEAMAAGLPVVASDIGGIDEQIGDGETGLLVPVGDADALARAVLALADDPARRRALGEAGRRHVSTTFTYDRQAAGLRKAYLAALAQPPRAAERDAGGLRS